MKSAIIIPYFGRYDLVHARLMEMYSHCPASEIVLVNDCSPSADCETGPAWWQSGPLKGRLRYYKNKENKGFGYSMNVGAEIAIKNGADILIFLSNDVIVKSDISKDAIELVEQHSNPILIGGMIWYNDTGWNNMPNVGVVPYADGWLLACHKDTWRILGGFDGSFGRADFEDVDLSTTAWYKGVKIIPFAKVKVQHLGGQTVNRAMPDRYAHTLMNKEVWIKKWETRQGELRKNIYG